MTCFNGGIDHLVSFPLKLTVQQSVRSILQDCSRLGRQTIRLYHSCLRKAKTEEAHYPANTPFGFLTVAL